MLNIQKIEDPDNVKTKITDDIDRVRICLPIILDAAASLFIGILAGLISSFGAMMRVFGIGMLVFLIAHFMSYLTIVFIY